MRLKLRKREGLLIGLLVVAAAAALWQQLSGPGTTPARLSRSSPEEAPLPPIPRIDLARLEAPQADVEVGRRDLFDYGRLERPALDPETQTTTPSAPRTPLAPAADPSASLAGAGGASLPQLNLKFIGSVGNAEGVKVAVLLTDRNEVLTGQSGEVVANRFRIARIGIESVDIEDVGTGQSRRIPLKGN